MLTMTLMGLVAAVTLAAPGQADFIRPPFKVDAKALIWRTQRLAVEPTEVEASPVADGSPSPGRGPRVFRGEKVTVLEWRIEPDRVPLFRVRAEDGRTGWAPQGNLVAAASVKIATTLEPVPTFDRADGGADRATGRLSPADLLFVLRRSGEFSEVDGSGGVRGWVRTAALRIVEADVELLRLLMVRAGSSDDPATVARITSAIQTGYRGHPIAVLLRGAPDPVPPPRPLTPEEAAIRRRFGEPDSPEVLLGFTDGINDVLYSIRRSDLAIASVAIDAGNVIDRNFVADSHVWMSVAATTGEGASLPPESRPRIAPFKDASRADWARLPDGTLIWIEYLDQVDDRFRVLGRWALSVQRGKRVSKKFIEIVLEGG